MLKTNLKSIGLGLFFTLILSPAYASVTAEEFLSKLDRLSKKTGVNNNAPERKCTFVKSTVNKVTTLTITSPKKFFGLNAGSEKVEVKLDADMAKNVQVKDFGQEFDVSVTWWTSDDSRIGTVWLQTNDPASYVDVTIVQEELVGSRKTLIGKDKKYDIKRIDCRLNI